MDNRTKDRRREVGQRAERICERQLLDRGWSILARNWRVRFGEINLIARDGRTAVIVEVKSSRPGCGAGPVRPVLAVGPDKQRRLRRLASAWLSSQGDRARFEQVRFDVVGIRFGSDGAVVAYEHIEAAF